MKKKKARGITVQMRNTQALPLRAAVTARLLQSLKAAMGELFADENFLTLLEAESITMIPAILEGTLQETKARHEIA